MTLRGRATAEATAGYAARWSDRAAEEHFHRTAHDLTLSSIGLGTYLGQPDDATDSAYQA
ncbi:MAG: aldo/keto reductase, partial [Chloroflexi bacterium]